MRHAVIIPGFRETGKTQVYGQLANLFSRQGVSAHIITPSWPRQTMTNYVAEVRQQLPTNPDTYLLGFSFGAYISLLLAAERTFRHLFLCSISPYFFETRSQIKKSWRARLGIRRMAELDQIRLQRTLPRVQSPASVFVGEREGRLMISVGRMVTTGITSRSTMALIAEVGHSIRDPKYYSTVRQDILQTLSTQRM